MCIDLSSELNGLFRIYKNKEFICKFIYGHHIDQSKSRQRRITNANWYYRRKEKSALNFSSVRPDQLP
jgi:hypothetical protein